MRSDTGPPVVIMYRCLEEKIDLCIPSEPDSRATDERKGGIIYAYIVRIVLADSFFTRLRYWSRNWMRPTVPNPTAAKKPAVHMQVTTRPVGKNARRVPGTTKGAALATAADAEAAAAAPVGVLVDCLANTPFTKDASWEERVAVTSWLEMGFFAESWIVGIKSGCRVALYVVSADAAEGTSNLLRHGGPHQIAVDLADVHEHLQLCWCVRGLPLHEHAFNGAVLDWRPRQFSLLEGAIHVLHGGT